MAPTPFMAPTPSMAPTASMAPCSLVSASLINSSRFHHHTIFTDKNTGFRLWLTRPPVHLHLHFQIQMNFPTLAIPAVSWPVIASQTFPQIWRRPCRLSHQNQVHLTQEKTRRSSFSWLKNLHSQRRSSCWTSLFSAAKLSAIRKRLKPNIFLAFLHHIQADIYVNAAATEKNKCSKTNKRDRCRDGTEQLRKKVFRQRFNRWENINRRDVIAIDRWSCLKRPLM